jgi:hypothetical protein
MPTNAICSTFKYKIFQNYLSMILVDCRRKKEVFHMQTHEMSMRVINYKRMRLVIGLVAFLMPIAVWLLSGHPRLSSISISYWTHSQDIFVGSLFAVGFFMMAYNGAGSCENWEKWLSRAAFVFAILIALFPTRDFNDQIDNAPIWILYISNNNPQILHYAAAVSLFICLFLMLLFFSFRASRKGKNGRSMTYFGFSIGIIIGMPILYYILDKRLGWYDSLFYVEGLGLWLFGAGWFIAGAYKTEDLKVPSGANELKTIPNVNPSERDFPTGMEVEIGAEYFFVAEGCWKDWFILCGPNGWGPKWKAFTYKNRIKGQPFFKLCGNVGKSNDKELMFAIGDKNSWPVPEKVNQLKDRELYLFANDWPTDFAYKNNKELKPDQGGPLKVTIYRLKTD